MQLIYLFAQVCIIFNDAGIVPFGNLKIVWDFTVFLKNGKTIPCSAKFENFEENCMQVSYVL